MSSTEISNRKRRKTSSTGSYLEESTVTGVVMAVASSSGFELLVDDTLDLVRQFLGKRSYGSYGRINKRCREVFLSKNLPKETFFCGYAPLSMIKEKTNTPNNELLGQAVVKYNRNDILQWLLLEKNKPAIVETFDIAAGISLNALKRVKNLVGNDAFTAMKIYEDWNVCREAASHDRLDVLDWLKSKGWFDPNGTRTGMRAAAENGNIPILEWLMENGCHLDHYVFFGAAEGGHLNMLEFLKENKCPFDPEGCMVFAACGGNLETIHWFLRNGCNFEDVHSWAIYNAAIEGHLHVMKFFIENGFSINDIDENTSYSAATGGHLHVLKWLHENNCPFDEWTFAKAAKNGNIGNLQWLLDNNFPWDKTCYSSAAESNKLEVLEWLKEKGCPRGDSVLFISILCIVSDKVKDWLLENGFTLEDEDHTPS